MSKNEKNAPNAKRTFEKMGCAELDRFPDAAASRAWQTRALQILNKNVMGSLCEIFAHFMDLPQYRLGRDYAIVQRGSDWNPGDIFLLPCPLDRHGNPCFRHINLEIAEELREFRELLLDIREDLPITSCAWPYPETPDGYGFCLTVRGGPKGIVTLIENYALAQGARTWDDITPYPCLDQNDTIDDVADILRLEAVINKKPTSFTPQNLRDLPNGFYLSLKQAYVASVLAEDHRPSLGAINIAHLKALVADYLGEIVPPDITPLRIQ
jgi:hypothetical protein